MGMGDIYRLAVVGRSGGGVQLVNVLHYRAITGTILETQSQDLAQAWFDSVLPAFLDTFQSSGPVDKITVRGVTDIEEGFDLNLTPPLPTGTRTGDAMPPQVAAIVTWTTGKIGRRFRGRSYLWPCSEADQNAGAISAGYKSSIGAYAEAAMEFGDGLTTSLYEMVVHSNAEGGPYDTKVTGYVARDYFGGQDRRKYGRGA